MDIALMTEHTKKLLKLLQSPNPGLASWHETVGVRLEALNAAYREVPDNKEIMQKGFRRNIARKKPMQPRLKAKLKIADRVTKRAFDLAGGKTKLRF